ncbi:pyruvate formate-lyase-activating protein [Asanoa sp. NPDC049573]|uniref:pyruvate formate-lyase-activating protein n=1 Tax=Asanoa sp. NPDC049573 TaxID=3155396 RepID=UPI00342B47CD
MRSGPTPFTGSVHSFDISTGVDGPGSRFVAFLAGCPLRCAYCHSPDTWYRRSGTLMSVDDLMLEIERYRRFIQVAGGGVTISGGEPLQQVGFTREVLRRCHALKLHTALDTSGFLGHRADHSLLDVTDLVLLDVKSWDPATYRKVTGTGDVMPTLRFARRLAAYGVPMWIRFVLVPGLTDNAANLEGLADFLATLSTLERVEILPFHKLGAHKYEQMGLTFPLAGARVPAADEIARAHEVFAGRGLVTC